MNTTMKIIAKSPSRVLQTLPFPYRTHEATAGIDSVFLTSFDIYKCEEPNPGVTIHTPFLSLTVGLAAMVHEPSIVALWPSINDSILELQKNPQKTTFQSAVINCNQPALRPLASAGRWYGNTASCTLSFSSKTEGSQRARTVQCWLSGKQGLPVASLLGKHHSAHFFQDSACGSRPQLLLKSKIEVPISNTSVYRRQTGRVCKLRYTGAQLVMGLERRGKLQLRFAFVVMREIFKHLGLPHQPDRENKIWSVWTCSRMMEKTWSSNCYPAPHLTASFPHLHT